MNTPDASPDATIVSDEPVTAIILDIGNVICEWNPVKLAKSALPADQREDEAIISQLMHDTVQQEDWVELDRGTIPLDQAISNAQSRSSLDPAWIERLYHNTPVSLEPLPETVAAMQEIKDAGMPLYILSNMQAHAGDYLKANHKFFGLVDHIVLSCDCNYVKPDADIYNYTIKTLGLDAATSVFIDDMTENVQGAIDCGLQSIQMTDLQAGGTIIRSLLARSGLPG